MNRTILPIAGVFGASDLLLVDSAIKATALLVLAAVAAMVLRRDSAADSTSRVGAGASSRCCSCRCCRRRCPSGERCPVGRVSHRGRLSRKQAPARPPGPRTAPWNCREMRDPWASSGQPRRRITAIVELPDSRPASAKPAILPQAPRWNWERRQALTLVWAIGFFGLILRLLAARWMLRNSERRGTAALVVVAARESDS